MAFSKSSPSGRKGFSKFLRLSAKCNLNNSTGKVFLISEAWRRDFFTGSSANAGNPQQFTVQLFGFDDVVSY